MFIIFIRLVTVPIYVTLGLKLTCINLLIEPYTFTLNNGQIKNSPKKKKISLFKILRNK